MAEPKVILDSLDDIELFMCSFCGSMINSSDRKCNYCREKKQEENKPEFLDSVDWYPLKRSYEKVEKD